MPDLLPAPSAVPAPGRAPRLWTPHRVLITASAREHAHGVAIAERCAAQGIDVVDLPGDRLTGLRGDDERATYRRAKGTLAIVVSPPSSRRLQPIPPSADFRLDVARGCPAHCQYCYLAGSLPGPPVTRVYADLDEILDASVAFEGQGRITSASADRAHENTTFEASCYTDPLALEHLTGSVARAVEHFGRRPGASLRFTTKYDDVGSFLDLPHGGHTRMRASVNARSVERYEGGTARVAARLDALRRMALAGYRVGLTIAPIMPVDGWREEYAELLDLAAQAMSGVERLDLTVELITHRFTDTSKQVLTGWYPSTRVDMDEEARTLKRTKFRGTKHVYPKAVMTELRDFFEREVDARLPGARILYFT